MEELINSLIKESKVDTNKISDGYHTFGELYEHRIELWITLCRIISRQRRALYKPRVWRSKKHSDGTSFDGWFLLGINVTNSIQMTYHLPLSKWNECHFAEVYETAPDWDGHTSADVLKRLRML